MSTTKCEKPKKCKCCNTAISKSFRFIYDEEGKELNIEFLLLDCVGKKVSEKNGSDQAICTKCLLQLQQSYEFKRKCLEAADESDVSDNESEFVLGDESSLNSFTVDHGEQLTNVIEDPILTLDEQFVIDETFEERTYDMIDSSSLKIGDDDESDVEIKFIEIIDVVEDVNLDNCSNAQQHVNDKLSTSITLPTVKKKFAKNAPSHRIKFKPEILLADSKAIDVEKIRTSDDLVHILEDDYHSENDSNRKRFTDITDEFKIPKIEVEDFCDNIEYLDESKPIDLDEYIKLVTLISYDEKKCFLSDVKCVVSAV